MYFVLGINYLHKHIGTILTIWLKMHIDLTCMSYIYMSAIYVIYVCKSLLGVITSGAE